MQLLASGMSHGQAVTLTLLCIFMVIFIVADVFMVLSLRKKNKELAQKSEKENESEERTSRD